MRKLTNLPQTGHAKEVKEILRHLVGQDKVYQKVTKERHIRDHRIIGIKNDGKIEIEVIENEGLDCEKKLLFFLSIEEARKLIGLST